MGSRKVIHSIGEGPLASLFVAVTVVALASLHLQARLAARHGYEAAVVSGPGLTFTVVTPYRRSWERDLGHLGLALKKALDTIKERTPFSGP